MVSKESRAKVRMNKHRKIRNRFSGTTERPRLAVFRSNNHMYAQIIDDTVGNTLCAASTTEKEVKAELEKTNDVAAAAYLGTVIAKRALEKGITTVVIPFSIAFFAITVPKYAAAATSLVCSNSAFTSF